MTRLDLAATAFPRRPRRWIQADAFLQQWPQWHGQIRDALASEDADALEVAAHALKGSARSIAAGAVSETAVELEDAARDRRLADARRAWQRLRPEMVELRRALAPARRRASGLGDASRREPRVAKVVTVTNGHGDSGHDTRTWPGMTCASKSMGGSAMELLLEDLMARQATDGTKLPRQHFSGITWIALVALTLAIAVFVAWQIWFPSYSIIPR